MVGIVQEKFQHDYPQQPNDDAAGRGWLSDKAARAKKNMPGFEGRQGRDGSTGKNAGDRDSRLSDEAAQFNTLPPGMDIEDQEVTDQRRFATVMAGESDVSQDYNPESVRTGARRLKMRATDDEYSNAHVDAFYDEIVVDGDTGFTERNNTLDRM
jgi:hypothetical protein